MNIYKNIILIILVILVFGGITYLNSQKASRNTIGGNVEVETVMEKEEKANIYPTAKEITTPDGFINTDDKPVTIGEFVGKKVVLIDFWTYSCINCQRTTPYLNAWYEKYKDDGLVIIGVHTPEFEFEKKYKNVLEATKRMGIKFPVALDNDFSTWNAYENRFWPRKYLIDIDGYVIYDHIGEGGYEETEKKIQEALKERVVVLGMKDNISKDIVTSIEVTSGDRSKPKSPEIYFGATRNSLENGKSQTLGIQSFKEPVKVNVNSLYLGGDWDLKDEFAENKSKGAKIIFRYQAKDVYIVASSEEGVNVSLLLDGKPLAKEGGEDVFQGSVFIKEDRLYKIIQDSEGFGEHTLELIIEKPGMKAFTFTFG